MGYLFLNASIFGTLIENIVNLLRKRVLEAFSRTKKISISEQLLKKFKIKKKIHNCND